MIRKIFTSVIVLCVTSLFITAEAQDVSKLPVSLFPTKSETNVGSYGFRTEAVFLQNDTTSAGSVSTVSSEGIGYYTADDLQLEQDTQIKSIETIGYQIANNLESIITGMKVYIYSDDNGKPSGVPTTTGTPLYEVEIDKVDTSSFSMTVNEDGFYHFMFSVDFSAVAGERYWLVLAPIVNFTEGEVYNTNETFNQFFSNDAHFSNAMSVDANDYFGIASIGWYDLYAFFGSELGEEIKALAFALYDVDCVNMDEVIGVNKTAVYPNPAYGEINISAEEFDYCEIYDITGRTIMTSRNPRVDVSALSDGNYLVKVVLKSGKQATSKIIVRN